jgi:hypothetical protein
VRSDPVLGCAARTIQLDGHPLRNSAAIELAVVGVAGLPLASAAQLTVTGGSLGAGTKVVASCHSDTAARFANTYSSTGYRVTSVVLSEVSSACNGLKYSVQLTTGSGTALGSPITGTLTVTGLLDAGTATIAVSPAVDALSVTGVSVVIYS